MGVYRPREEGNKSQNGTLIGWASWRHLIKATGRGLDHRKVEWISEFRGSGCGRSFAQTAACTFSLLDWGRGAPLNGVGTRRKGSTRTGAGRRSSSNEPEGKYIILLFSKSPSFEVRSCITRPILCTVEGGWRASGDASHRAWKNIRPTLEVVHPRLPTILIIFHRSVTPSL